MLNIKLTLSGLLFCFLSFGQIGMGQWRLHVPARKAIDVASGNGIIYTAFVSGVLEYDVAENETSLWTDVNGLSDITISSIGYDNARSALFIGYENGNLDKIQNNRVTNIPAIKLAEIPGSKVINKIVPYGNYIYLATGFAVVKIDPVKNEVKDTWYPTNGNDAILDLAIRNDSIFALSSSRLYRGYLQNFALVDPSQWVVDARVPVLTANTYKEIELVNNDLYLLFQKAVWGQDSVYRINNSGLQLVTNESFTLEINSLKNQQGKLGIGLYDAYYIYNSDFSYSLIANVYSFGGEIRLNNAVLYDNLLWIADNNYGLVRYYDPYSSIRISFEGPPKNEFYSLDWSNNKLAIAGGGLSGTQALYSASGVYTFEAEKWALLERGNNSKWGAGNIWDFLCVAIDPNDKEKMAVGTFSSVPVSIINGATVSDTFTPYNSTLKFTEPGGSLSLVTSMQYDQNGNLWVLNGYAEKVLNVYTKNGLWYSFDCGVPSKNKFSKKLVIDYNGNKWFSIDGSGIFAYNDNNTPENPGDDKVKQLNSGDFTGALPSNTVNALAVDFDNEIWIGTDNGFAVLYNSNGVFDATSGNYNAQRIKVQFEGNVEYILGNTNVTDIEVDGGNRKWFGTANSGIILLSADGTEVLEQHTTENSPLISNNIIDLELDQTTGELFIITDKGLVSYRTDASYQDANYSDVKVFPNPAYPDFAGPITIQGIRYNSDVKITDVAGNLVYQTTSNGGTATWNGKNSQGEKVTTGVYLIWTAANEGKGRKVGKVLVVH